MAATAEAAHATHGRRHAPGSESTAAPFAKPRSAAVPRDADAGAPAPSSDGSPDERLQAAAIDAYLAARAWLDAEQLPRPEEPAAAVELPGVTAVAVLLRLDGRLVGAADDAGEPRLLVRRALGRALAKALGDETIRAVREGVGDRVAKRLSLEIEVAGPLKPLLGRTIAEAAARVDRGREGIALRRGESVVRAFPSRLSATDGADRPDRIITALIGEAGLPARDLNDFGVDDRVSLARFATVRMRGDAPGSTPAIVERGGRTVPAIEITPAATRALAAQLASRLAAQVVARDPAKPDAGAALLGTLQPAEDRYDPPFASERETAFAAFALSRIARDAGLPEPVRASVSAKHAALVLALASIPQDRRSALLDALEALACARMCTEPPAQAEPAGLREAQLARLLAHRELASKADPETRGFLAVALAGFDDAAARAASDAILDALLADAQTRPGLLVDAALPLAVLARGGPASMTHLPTASTTHEAETGVAHEAAEPVAQRNEPRTAREEDSASARTDPTTTPGQPDATTTRRERVRAALEEAARVASAIQLRSDAAPGGENAAMLGHPLDLEGGLLLPGPRGTIPTTQSLRLAAALAISEPVLDPAKAPERAVTQRNLLRFLAQHVAQDPWVGGFRSPDAVRGLVRDSLDRDDCPPAATAAGAMLAAEAASQKPRKP